MFVANRNSQENKHGGVQSYYSYRPFNSIQQDPTTSGAFVEIFQSLFLCNKSRRLLLNSQTILIVPSPSSVPYLYVVARGGGELTNSGFYVGNPPGQQYIEDLETH